MIVLSEHAIIALTAALAHLTLCGYHAFKKGVKQLSTNLLTGYLFLAAGWNLLILLQESRLLGHFTWDTAFVYPLIPLAILLWLFTNAFLQQPGRPYLKGVIPGIVVLLWMAVIDYGYIASSQISLPFVKGLLNRRTVVFWLAIVTTAGYLLHAVWIMIKTQKEMHSPSHRNRVQFLLFTLLVAAAGLGLYLSLIPPAQEIGLIVQWLGALLLIYVSITHDLLDIRTGFKELVSFSVIVLSTLAIYLSTIYILEKLLSKTSRPHLKTALISAFLLTLLYPLLRYVIQATLRRTLFRYQYDDKQIIKAYIQAINNIMFMEDLVSVSLFFIEKNLQIESGAFFLLRRQDNTHYHFTVLTNRSMELPKRFSLKKNTPLTQQLIEQGRSLSQYTLDIAPQFCQVDQSDIQIFKEMAFEQYAPIKRLNELVAILAVGPFVSGLPYASPDIELLSTLANQTAIALENARLFEDVRQNLEEITRIKNLMDSVFASIESGVITVDTQDQIVFLNQAAYRILKLPEDIRPGSAIDAVLTRLKNTPLAALLRDVKNTQRSYHAYEITPAIPERGPVNLSVDLSPIIDAQKQLKGTAVVINDYTETKRLLAVQNLFRKYVSPAVVDRLPHDPTELKLGGHRHEVTILFADIRGFSAFSEYQDPEDLIKVLNKYLAMAAEAILAFEGTLDKFMGDAVMAIFNAPLPQPDHPLKAVKAAAAMQRSIAKSHQMLDKNAPQLDFGVGIHVGEAVIGNVGAHFRMDYTAIGDAVNLAKRIQEKTPGGKILLSEQAYLRVKNHVRAIPHKKMTVKGRQTPEQTYELLNIL